MATAAEINKRMQLRRTDALKKLADMTEYNRKLIEIEKRKYEAQLAKYEKEEKKRYEEQNSFGRRASNLLPAIGGVAGAAVGTALGGPLLGMAAGTTLGGLGSLALGGDGSQAAMGMNQMAAMQALQSLNAPKAAPGLPPTLDTSIDPSLPTDGRPRFEAQPLGAESPMNVYAPQPQLTEEQLRQMGYYGINAIPTLGK